MREPTYPIIVALALMLVAPSLSAFGRGGARGGGFEEREAPEEQTTRAPEERLRAPEERTIRLPEERTIRAPEEQTPLRTQTFAGHAYHGQLAWRDGRWLHEAVGDRDGWWWDVGGYQYFYPEQIEGPPNYVSDVEVENGMAPSDSPSPPATPEFVSPPATSTPSPPAPSASPSPPAKIWISPQ
jgi:hypothetical protein